MSDISEKPGERVPVSRRKGSMKALAASEPFQSGFRFHFVDHFFSSLSHISHVFFCCVIMTLWHLRIDARNGSACTVWIYHERIWTWWWWILSTPMHPSPFTPLAMCATAQKMTGLMWLLGFTRFFFTCFFFTIFFTWFHIGHVFLISFAMSEKHP